MPGVLDLAIRGLRRKFPGKSSSWIKRAILRLGDIEEKQGYFIVRGRPELGDRYPEYLVWFSERERRWYCTCYASAWGHLRARHICTHVAAVMLYLERRKTLERLGSRPAYVVEAEVECRGRITANGDLYLLPVGRSLEAYARPRFKALVVSMSKTIRIRCEDKVVVEAEGEEMPLAAAAYLAEEWLKSKGFPEETS